MMLDKGTANYCIDCGNPISGTFGGGARRCKACRKDWKGQADAAIERALVKAAERREAEEGMTREY